MIFNLGIWIYWYVFVRYLVIDCFVVVNWLLFRVDMVFIKDIVNGRKGVCCMIFILMEFIIFLIKWWISWLVINKKGIFLNFCVIVKWVFCLYVSLDYCDFMDKDCY